MPLNNIVRISAAGSGKTYTICHEALSQIDSSSKRVLIVTYTNRGVESIQNEICKANYGVIPQRLIIRTWYSFLLKDLIKPYQHSIFDINELKRYTYLLEHIPNYQKSGTRSHYLDSKNQLRSETASELAIRINNMNGGLIINRLEQIYSAAFIDEVQDMAGYDLNIIEAIMRSNIFVTIVGDGKQATFKTHWANKNKNASGSNFSQFFTKMQEEGIVQLEISKVSRRFNSEICEFCNNIYPNENNITTSMHEITHHDGVFIIMKENAQEYIDYFRPAVLRYDIRTKTDENIAYNFGECKGMTFDRVLIYPNGPLINFLSNGKSLSSPEKYYVAVTRARYSIAIVMDKVPICNCEKQEILLLDDNSIPVWHIIPNH